MKKIALFVLALAPFLAFSQNVGVGTTTPQSTLHVNGSLQVTNQLNVGGNSSTVGNPGASGNLLVSQGAGSAPVWNDVHTMSGVITSTFYMQGTKPDTIANGSGPQVVSGLDTTVNVLIPQKYVFTITGYMTALNAGYAAQGVFSLYVDGNKITSAYTSCAASGNTGSGVLGNLPHPATMLYSLHLNPGSHHIQVKYTAWNTSEIVNVRVNNYSGFTPGDDYAMYTRMLVLIYNE